MQAHVLGVGWGVSYEPTDFSAEKKIEKCVSWEEEWVWPLVKVEGGGWGGAIKLWACAC